MLFFRSRFGPHFWHFWVHFEGHLGLQNLAKIRLWVLGGPLWIQGLQGGAQTWEDMPIVWLNALAAGVARIATNKTIAAYESPRIMPIMPNWETGKVYEAWHTVKCLLRSLTCYMLGYYFLGVLHVAYCKPGLRSLVAPQGGRRIFLL